MRREIDCAICDKPVVIPTKHRFLQMVRERRRPLCGQCRRYARECSGGAEIPASARDIEVSEETEVTAMVLGRKLRARGRKRTALASRRLRRVAKRGFEPRSGNE